METAQMYVKFLYKVRYTIIHLPIVQKHAFNILNTLNTCKILIQKFH